MHHCVIIFRGEHDPSRKTFMAMVLGYTSAASETALLPVARLILRAAIGIPRWCYHTVDKSTNNLGFTIAQVRQVNIRKKWTSKRGLSVHVLDSLSQADSARNVPALCGNGRSGRVVGRERQCLFSYASRLPSSIKSMLDPCSISPQRRQTGQTDHLTCQRQRLNDSSASARNMCTRHVHDAKNETLIIGNNAIGTGISPWGLFINKGRPSLSPWRLCTSWVSRMLGTSGRSEARPWPDIPEILFYRIIARRKSQLAICSISAPAIRKQVRWTFLCGLCAGKSQISRVHRARKTAPWN